MEKIVFDRGRSFAQIVYQILVVERRCRVEDAAKAIGMHYDAFYARVNGRTAFTADEIAALVALIPDPRLVGYLLRHSDLVAVQRSNIKLDETGRDIIEATHRVLIEAADVLEAVDLAYQDRRIDHREAQIIKKEIDIVESALLTLREHIIGFIRS